jgi:tryptophan synthase alpha chain
VNRLIDATADLRRRNARGLVPFVTAGDGGFDVSLAVIEALADEGASAIELGLAFSDPLADGPLLQAAAERALQSGSSLEALLALARAFRRHHATPLVLMSYANPLYVRGLERATAELAAAGFDGLLAVDVPPEEDAQLGALCAEHKLARIHFTSPTSPAARLSQAVAASSGFLYAIARLGVTGAATEQDAGAQEFLARARAVCVDLPLAVGFGISNAAHVRAAVQHADLAIVGSALVERVHQPVSQGGGPLAAAKTAAEFLLSLKTGLQP